MSNLHLVHSGLNVAPMHWALLEKPWLWDQERVRTESPDSPHFGLSDIYLRYGPKSRDFEEHDSFWWPSAQELPAGELVYPLMAAVRGERLGMVLITKIPAGKECRPHVDGGWHAKYYEKFAIQIASAPGQKFCFEGEELETKPGDVFWFNNSATHWVTNPTPYERITMIVCIKRGA